MLNREHDRLNQAKRDEYRRWIRQWKAAADKLEGQRALELSMMTDNRAGKLSRWLLNLAGDKRFDISSSDYSGLVEQQRYFMR